MWKVGLSTNGKGFSAELFRQYRDAGITEMEISEGGYRQFDYAAAERWSKEYGVHLWSLHLPFVPFETIDVSSPDKAIRDYTVGSYAEIIKRAGDIGIGKCIVHPSAEIRAECDRDERIACGCDTLCRLAEIAEPNGVTICVEDLPRLCLGHSAEEIEQLVAADDRLRVCFDTNHLLSEDPVDFVKRIGDKIVTLHISDYDFVNERHWLPGEGQIRWPALVAALQGIGYQGPWLYEISFQCPNTILRDRPLTAADFARNADEVLGGKPITVFSTPKPNLGMWE